ncbi:MAG: hypothetical protein NVSMB53_04670 [Gemmatimonadaceae bacterium]
MIGHERNDVGLIVHDENTLRSGVRFSHGWKLSDLLTLSQLAACHEHVTIPLHSLA